MITVIGQESNGGTYILKITLREDVSISFGRFLRGKKILLQKGIYLYIGSALKQKGSSSLAYRLVRHSSRSADKPHSIQSKLINFFNNQGMAISTVEPPLKKTLHWNIDFLLDEKESEILEIIILRSRKPMENTWAIFLENEPETEVIEKGLGANDSIDQTHLLKVQSTEKWWKDLPTRLSLLANESNIQIYE